MLSKEEALIDYSLRIADDRLILGHRLSEWCGHAPILEEDIAISNIALDLVGQASNVYKYTAELEGKGKTEDDYVFWRNDLQFKNLMLVEQPNGDFAQTIARNFLFDSFAYHFLTELKNSKNELFAGFAEKSIKENRYHLRHTSQWMLRLGDGTEESHERLDNAVEFLWIYTGDMFTMNAADEVLLKEGIAVDLEKIKPEWQKMVTAIFDKATLAAPDFESFTLKGSRDGKHSEYLGHLLSEMQILPRSMPDAKW